MIAEHGINGLSTQRLNPLEGGDPSRKSADNRNSEKIKKATQEFEALFVTYMLKVMRESGSKESGGLSLGPNNPFQDMFDWELAKDLSKNSPLGVAEALMRQLNSVSDMPDSDAENFLNKLDLKSLTIGQTSASTKVRDTDDINEIIERAAKKYKLEPALIRSVIATESAGDTNAVSIKGARGLMQLMDSTAAELGVKNPFDPEENIFGGTAYLKKMLDRYEGDPQLALAAYNAGPGAVDKYEGIPPYPETQAYVKKIISRYQQLIDNNVKSNQLSDRTAQ